MSAYVFVSVAGGSLGLLAGGLLTRGAELALGVLRQPPDRRRRVRARPGADPGRRGARARARSRLARLAARHRLADERDLRDRRRPPSHGWVSSEVLGFGGARGGADGGVPRARGADREPDHAAAHPPPARAGQRQPRQGVPRHRHVLDVLPRHALPRARPPLRRAADRRGVPALDAHRRRALAGDHRAAGHSLRAAPRADGGHGERGRRACCCSARSARTPRSSRRSSSPASRSASASATRSCRC